MQCRVQSSSKFQEIDSVGSASLQSRLDASTILHYLTAIQHYFALICLKRRIVGANEGSCKSNVTIYVHHWNIMSYAALEGR